MKDSSLEAYIAKNNPSEVCKVLRSFGSPAIQAGDIKTLLYRVHEATIKKGEPFLRKLAQVETPYRSLILTEYEKSKTANSGENKSNCCGVDGEKSSCACGCGSSSGIDGEGGENTPMFKTTHDLKLVGLLLLGAATITMIAKS